MLFLRYRGCRLLLFLRYRRAKIPLAIPAAAISALPPGLFIN